MEVLNKTYCRVRGISFPEMLIAISAIGITLGLGVVGVRGVVTSVKSDALADSVRAMNRAVGLYLASGGTIASDATAGEVIGDLKRAVAADDRGTVVGLTGGFIDPRLTVRVLPTAYFKAGEERVTWNAAHRRFELTTQSVPGFRAFERDDSASTSAGRRSASGTVHYARSEDWVWDYADGGPGGRRGLDQSIEGGTIYYSEAGPAQAADPLKLDPPSVSVPGGLYPYDDFRLPVVVTNPNPDDGQSEIYYSINGSEYRALESGAELSVPRNAELHAFVRSLNHDEWIDSNPILETYASESILFSGSASGLFSDPIGDSGMVTNLTSGQASNEFWFGDPASGYRTGNYLRFDGADFSEVGESESFVLGALTYYNSTTYLGSNATGVTFNVNLNLRVPSLSEVLNFDFSLMSTPNRSYQTADQNADYVWVGDLTSQLETTIGGDLFTLDVFFGQLDANGYTTIDTFHVHEGATATGWLYGRLSKSQTAAAVADGEDPLP